MNPWSIYYGVLIACSAARTFIHSKKWELFLWTQDVLIRVCLERCSFGFAARFREICWNYWIEHPREDTTRVLDLRNLSKEHKETIYDVTESESSSA
jgi:hypothetical protein